MIYFPTNWGAKEPQNLPNHRVVSFRGCKLQIFFTGNTLMPLLRNIEKDQVREHQDDFGRSLVVLVGLGCLQQIFLVAAGKATFSKKFCFLAKKNVFFVENFKKLDFLD